MADARKGRIVHYVMPADHPEAGKVYPAIILQAYTPACAKLHVFGANVTVDSVNVRSSVNGSAQGEAFWPDFNGSDVEFTTGMPAPAPVSEPTVTDPGEPKEPLFPVVSPASEPTDQSTDTSSTDTSSTGPIVAPTS